jgi:hypothetical protein
LKLLGIVPHSANCERIFSVLRWFYGQRRTKLSANRIAMMAKIHSYYISNAKNQLQYYGNLLSENEIQDQVIFATQNLTDFQEIQDEDSLDMFLLDEEYNDKLELVRELVDENELNRVLEIEVYVDLSNQIFIDNEISINSENNNFMEDFGNNINSNFNIEDLVNQAFEEPDF